MIGYTVGRTWCCSVISMSSSMSNLFSSQPVVSRCWRTLRWLNNINSVSKNKPKIVSSPLVALFSFFFCHLLWSVAGCNTAKVLSYCHQLIWTGSLLRPQILPAASIQIKEGGPVTVPVIYVLHKTNANVNRSWMGQLGSRACEQQCYLILSTSSSSGNGSVKDLFLVLDWFGAAWPDLWSSSEESNLQ